MGGGDKLKMSVMWPVVYGQWMIREMQAEFLRVFLDLSKAFDLVNHDILLAKLAKYHTETNTMEWFRSYLTRRTQVGSVSGVLASPLNLEVGAP